MAHPGHYEKRLLIAKNDHIVRVVKQALPSGFVFDAIKFDPVVFKKTGFREVSLNMRCIVAFHRSGISRGYERVGHYRLITDIHDPGQVRVSEFFEWDSGWTSTRGMSSGRSRSKKR